MTLQVAFRTDASLQMGSGHVMRCLTLADALRARGANCHFISRAHIGNLEEVILERGYKIHAPQVSVRKAQEPFGGSAAAMRVGRSISQPVPAHAAWLGSSWQTDAQETVAALSGLQPDWLVVDHYALDHRWEEVLAAHCHKLLVIDDLADRHHRCDLLLDQNLGRQPQDYVGLVPTNCHLLTGPRFALLRPEFAALRSYSVRRHQVHPDLRQVLITMGGVDQSNATRLVLQALRTCALPQSCHITVAMGLTAPWLQDVRELAGRMPWCTDVVVNVNDMAHLMADSDLAIGAAGGTSWERCCLGLPTLLVVLSENQKSGAQALAAAHAARLIGEVSDIAVQLPLAINELSESGVRIRMSLAASTITDGLGVEKVLRAMGVICD